MSAHEVITIQCGHYSNFIGTHWWNLQESAFCYDDTSKEPREILTDCMFREGLTLTGQQTYTPRLLAIDLPGSLKTLKEDGKLYETSEQKDPVWLGDVEKHVTEPVQKNDFLSDLEQLDSGQLKQEVMETRQYDLQSSVEVWTDFLRNHLHPKSLLTVPGFTHNDSSGSFDVFPAGAEVWASRKFRDSFEDQLHFFLEECDHLQGLQLLVDWDSGFGALGSCIAQELADELGTKGLLAFSVSRMTSPADQTDHFYPLLLNNALVTDQLSSHCSLLCPLSLLQDPWRSHTSSKHSPTKHHKGDPLRTFPLIDYQADLPYHSSALMGAALETCSLLYRTEQAPFSLATLADSLTIMGRKVCSMGLHLPFPLTTDSTLISELDHTPLHRRLHPLTPYCTPGDDVRWSQAIAIRGIPQTYPLCFPSDVRYSTCGQSPSLAVATHLAQHFPTSTVKTNFSVVRKPLCVGTPFPSILPREHVTNNQVAAVASIHAESGLYHVLSNLCSELKHTNVKKYPSYSLDQDTVEELVHSLTILRDNYRALTIPAEESSDSDD